MDHGRKKRTWVKKTVAVAVAVLLVLAVSLFNFFLPFRTLLPAAALPARSGTELRVYFLDVGQGDCSVVQFPDGSALVIDAGDGSWENDNKLYRFFKGLRATSLTYVATHADADHCGGFAEIMKEFGGDELYLPAIGGETDLYRAMLEAAKKKNIPTKTAKRYETMVHGGAYAVFLSPYSQGETDENDSSSVLYLRYGETTVLFTADMTASREKKLLSEYEIDQTLFDRGEYTVRLDEVDVLKVAHHGSDASSSEEWLALIRPEVSVISCGRDNPYGHPAGGAVTRLAECGSTIYRTDELGDVMLSAFPDGTYTVEWDW